MKSFLALLPLLLLDGTASALSNPEQESPDKLPALESARQSWLLDHTNTGLGGEFFRAFASYWRSQETGALVISVQETQASFFGHQISIWVGDRLLLQTRFYPSQRAAMNSLAEGTATAAAERLAQWQARGVPQP
ncbi:MAG: CsgE family curli-type amyloid fiber assembly protein [Pedobacter sp.]|nr:CsgE family curli-type amyloid fiber assembly protein [Pedobacter sp.]